MISQIKKFILLLDGLIIWLKENPTTSIPKSVLTRLDFIVQKIHFHDTISDEEWEKMKPKKEQEIDHSSEYILNESRRLHRETQAYFLNAQKEKAETEKLLKLIQLNKTNSQPNTTSIQNVNENNPQTVIINGKNYSVCPYCYQYISPKKINNHKNKCVVFRNIQQFNQNFNGNDKISQKNPTLTNTKIDSYFDGSKGYHNMRRENGRFGSYPSYDNMDDDFSPK